MKDKQQGAWFEGKIVRIVHNPKYTETELPTTSNSQDETKVTNKKLNDSKTDKRKLASATSKKSKSPAAKENAISKYFTKIDKQNNHRLMKTESEMDVGLLYQIKLDE